MNVIKRLTSFFLIIFIMIVSQGQVSSQVMSDYSAVPPFINESVPPLVMFVMSRDHKLFFKAYNDVSDLDDDGTIDSTYKDSIDYYGYFDSQKCYAYQNSRFEPAGSVLNPGTNHYCSGNWSGNFLNWATMARIDVLRKVLYGGYRSVDTSTTTVLSRTKLPRDAHSWSKAYNESNISSLTPFSWNSITLCNTNTDANEASSLIYVKNGYYPYAASTEGKQCTKLYQGGGDFIPDYTYNAEVLVCNDSTGQDCLIYVQGTSSPSYKPAGLLQEFGVNRRGTDDTSDDTVQMYFGLITGSYSANISGGVLRSNIVDVPTNEIDNSNGIIKGASEIVQNVNYFRILQYNYKTGWYDAGGNEGSCVPGEPTILTDGTCKSWGNPIGEMLYETIRYYKGTKACTSEYRPSNPDKGLSSLTVESQWDDPYENFPNCSKPFALILSDVYPSYDSDQLPGVYAGWASSISTSDTPSVTQLVSDSNINSIENIGNVMVGESAGSYDRRCTEKSGNFSSIRGLCIEEPTKQGAYYTPALAWYARTTDLHTADGEQNMFTYAVATGSPLPTIALGSGSSKAYILPTFHDGCPDASYPGCASQGDGGDNSKGELVDFQLCQSDADWTGEQVNGYQNCYDILWDDAEYGWDYDLDIRYRIYTKVNGSTVTVKTKGLYAAAGHTDYAGFYITGVSGAGEYLDIKCGGSAGFNDCDSYTGDETAAVERTFSIIGSSASILKDPLWYAAKYGGFTDKNNNNIPDLQSEWDKNGDGTPDTYFYASNPLKLESQLRKALLAISAKASSGTAVSVLATTGEGEGAVYQAYFYPEKIIEETGDSRNWLGYLNAIFVDKYGNLREDTNNNDSLDLTSDYIIDMSYNTSQGTRINKYLDANGDGARDSDTPVAVVELDNVNTIWKGGDTLWKTNPDNRTIFTSQNGYTAVDFITSNAATLEPYLRAADSTEAQNIIEWIRGDDLPGVTDAGHLSGYRERSVTINNTTNVWKLGDIIYSTPSVVARPMENYDLLYGEASYSNFRQAHLKRRHVVYVGANDGMLHAFNGGCFDAASHKYYPDVDVSGNCTTGSHSLGEELWAYIPRGLLPHLKWLTDSSYMHVYYVDSRPKITDVRIFNADSTHVDGWGTILIGGFRYGGKDISWTSGGNNYSASPEYFAIDITDPLNPRLLWTFSNSDLGLSMSYPAVAKIADQWFVIFGSGPTDYDINSNLTGYQNGNIFALKISGGSNGVIKSWTENTNFWKIQTGNSNTFLSDPITVDVDIDYDVDVVYIGENYLQGSTWNGLMKRITTNKGSLTDPSLWTLSTIANVSDIAGNNDVVKRITSAPSAAMDNRANLWLYFGTGQFFGNLDKNLTDTGAFYAVKDGCWNGSCSTSYTNLLDISTASVTTDGIVSGISGACGGGASTWGTLLTASQSCDGWSMFFSSVGENVDFSGNAISHNGERMLAKPLVLGGLVTWATYIPGTDVCSYEGESNVYAVYYKTGTAYKDYVFKDQKEQTNPSNTVARVKKLGAGMPSSLSAQVTASGTAKGFVQQSTGSILEIENVTPISLQSGVTGWRSEQIQ